MKSDIINFIRENAKELRNIGGALGLSGGVDSAICAALIAEAMGPSNCLGIIIPALDSNPQDAIDAEIIAKYLGIKTVLHPLNLSEFEFDKRDFEEEVKYLILNMDELLPPQIELPYIMKLRGRMLIVTYYARKNNYFQCETLEKTEWLLGWHDKFGDGVGDIAPIRHLYKTQVYKLAKKFVEEGKLPNLVINRSPGSGNYPLSDYDELGGITIEEVDTILNIVHSSTDLIRKRTNVSAEKIEKIKHLVKISEVKRKVPFLHYREKE